MGLITVNGSFEDLPLINLSDVIAVDLFEHLDDRRDHLAVVATISAVGLLVTGQ
jgi:hypothetical protein